jgi:hypothetical protein
VTTHCGKIRFLPRGEGELAWVGDGVEGDDAVPGEPGNIDRAHRAVRANHQGGLAVDHLHRDGQARPPRVPAQSDQIAQRAVPADHRPPRRRRLAAPVGPGDNVLGQHPLQRRHVPVEGGRQEPLQELAALLGRSREPLARRADALVCAAVQLPGVRLVQLQDLRNLAVAVTERLP